MKYIDIEKYNKIKELANNGDEKAKDFLFNFMEMEDEKANEFLSQIAVSDEEVKKDDFKDIIEFLINDELEAINGYDKAILFLASAEIPDIAKNEYKAKLEEIRQEELKHIEELKGLIDNGN